MQATQSPPDFAEATAVVADPLHFKARLGIGEDAYRLLRLRKAAAEAWDAAGAAATGAAFAASPPVATAFFGASGFWAAIGLGGAASTPVGWVILAGALSGGAWFGLSRALRGAEARQVTVIPHVINTPLDVLALGLFELMAPLALKVAAVDGPIGTPERAAIRDWFVRGWGYEAAFVDAALPWTEARLEGHAIRDLARALGAFKRDNPDCNAAAMAPELTAFLSAVATADGPLDEREEMAIERVARLVAEEARPAPLRRLRRLIAALPARLAARLRRPSLRS
ncbi:MAG: TerB family tellurite resistance protein [Rhodobacteraceae bacterium]|jgi:uncharacterized tellurite resistance protein B-like protein|nr:TerB family tellurite resistance protein [Paracoccaceae bacterium]